jgi:hypothetical protein
LIAPPRKPGPTAEASCANASCTPPNSRGFRLEDVPQCLGETWCAHVASVTRRRRATASTGGRAGAQKCTSYSAPQRLRKK